MHHSSKWLASWMLASGMAGLSSAARAQAAPLMPPRDLPSSGSLLRNNPGLNAPEAPQASDDAAAKTPVPALTGPEAAQGASFHVSRIEVQDLPDGAQAGVANITATYKDQQLTLGQLRDIAAQVTQVLVEHGETLSYASIPPQKIQDGIVKLRIVKGRLESLTLGQNKSLVSDKVLRAYLRRAEQHTGNLPALQDQLLLLSDLPGVGGVSPLLAAGQTAEIGRAHV